MGEVACACGGAAIGGDWTKGATRMLNGRARTEADKRAVVDQLYLAWIECPGMRLSQLLVSATRAQDLSEFCLVEDKHLAISATKFGDV